MIDVALAPTASGPDITLRRGLTRKTDLWLMPRVSLSDVYLGRVQGPLWIPGTPPDDPPPPDPTPMPPGTVAVRYVIDVIANVVPVETVLIDAAGVVPVRETDDIASVVPVREAPTEIPRVKVLKV